MINTRDHDPDAIINVQGTCTMCGAGDGDRWETEPSRIVRLSIGSRFWNIRNSDLCASDRTLLCDECQAGVEGLREAGVERKA